LDVQVDSGAESGCAGEHAKRELQGPPLHGLIVWHPKSVAERKLDADDAWSASILSH
jgi:hypothetical protein